MADNVATGRDASGHFIKGAPAWNQKPQIEKVCPTCGKRFHVRPSWDYVVCCSRSCARLGKLSPMLGRTASVETREKQRIAKLGNGGPTHWNWKHGQRRDRNAHWWRTAVFARSDYTCQMCGARGVTLNAHHIKAFSEYEELRHDVDNGIALCVPCHKEAHRKGR